METENVKILGCRESRGANFHGFILLWAREDKIFLNFKLGNQTERKNLSKPR